MDTVINQNWLFYLGEENEAFYKGFDDRAWSPVTLPHDWSVSAPFDKKHSSGTGYLAGGVGWYRKHLSLSDLNGKQVYLTFDGVYKNSRVWINSNYLGYRPFGFGSFTYDITPYVITGENVISVRAEHTDLADCRWFTGNGIYRDVTLTVVDAVHFTLYGTFITTEAVTTDTAKLRIRWELTDHYARAQFTLLSADGEAVAKTDLLTGQETTLSIPEPRLWSPDSPYLYTLQAQCFHNGILKDTRTYPVGIRTLRFDAQKGFFLNDIPTKLKGVCLHNDAGCLGAAVPANVWQRRLRKLKDAGCNAIRTAHNPPDGKLLTLCDQMGFLVMDEAFDEWEGCKNKWWQGHNVYPPKHYGYALDFPQWHKQDLEQMILRDRNHPCVILWSIGNEIDYPNDPYVISDLETMVGNNDKNKPEQELHYDANKPDAKRLATVARKLTAIVKALDPTRPVTAALSNPDMAHLIGLTEPLDVVGYNYQESKYEYIHAAYPHKAFLGSENSIEAANWDSVRDHEYVSALFIWTGVDYLGEAYGWPVRATNCGLLDMAGFEKPFYYQWKAQWTAHPFCKLAADPSGSTHYEQFRWEGTPGEEITVSGYTNAPIAQLYLNGESLGSKVPDHGRATWTLPYAPGKLELRCGEVSDTLSTPKNAAHLELRPVVCSAECAQVEIYAVDENGEPAKDITVQCNVIGEGKLLGMENGVIWDLTGYAENHRQTRNGRLIAYVRTDGPDCRLIAWSKETGEASLNLSAL